MQKYLSFYFLRVGKCSDAIRKWKLVLFRGNDITTQLYRFSLKSNCICEILSVLNFVMPISITCNSIIMDESLIIEA